jgi:N4-gp56 family major capsid protein
MDSLWKFGRRVVFYLAAVLGALVGSPVAFGMADEVTTTVLTNDEATEYIADKTLRIALYRLAAYQFAEKHTLKANAGRLFQMTRYEHLNLPQAPLTQGTTPANTAMTISTVTAQSEQWGAVVTMYDVPLLTIKHNVLQKAIELLGIQAAKVFERECQRSLMAAANVAFAGTSNVTRNGLASGDVLTSLDIQKAVASLRHSGAEDWSRTDSNTTSGYLKQMASAGGGTTVAKPGLERAYTGFIGIVDSYTEQDIIKDATFVLAAQYGNIRALYAGEVGMWLGVVFVRATLMPQITLLTSPSCTSANQTGGAGALVAATNYDVSVTRVRKAYGLEEAVSANIDIATSGGHESIAVTLPAGATYMYHIYIGSNGGTRYRVETAGSTAAVAADDLAAPYAASQDVYINALPTDGETSPVDPAASLTVHVCWIFGKEAFGCVDLAKLQAYLTKNEATDSDPLAQRRKAGWKAMFKCVIQNDDFIRAIESTSAFV